LQTGLMVAVIFMELFGKQGVHIIGVLNKIWLTLMQFFQH
jgi:hypothetical protein